MAARRAKIPAVVHTIHGLAFTASTHPAVNWIYKMLEKRAAPMTSRIVCVAEAMRQQSLAAGIGRAEQYLTIYSGMETEPFIHPPVARDRVRHSLGLSDDHIVVGTIARLFDLKGHDDLLQIAPKLCGEFPNLRFLWVGDGLLRGRFEAEMSRLGLRDRFVLSGMVSPERVPELTGAMDILVHPSRREGLARRFHRPDWRGSRPSPTTSTATAKAFGTESPASCFGRSRCKKCMTRFARWRRMNRCGGAWVRRGGNLRWGGLIRRLWYRRWKICIGL